MNITDLFLSPDFSPRCTNVSSFPYTVEENDVIDASGVQFDAGTISYQWYRDGEVIIGQTSSTYTVVVGDIGSKIHVKVTSTFAGRECTVNSHKINTTPTYYVSAEGSPGSNGLTPATALNLSDFLAMSLTTGTTVYFRRGDTFEITEYDLTWNNVTFDAYGPGYSPIFTGGVDISSESWTSLGSGLYSATVSPNLKWVFLGGFASRWAETGWRAFDSKPSANIIRVSAATKTYLNALPDSLVGAQLRIFEENWTISLDYTITAYDSVQGDITLNRNIVGGNTVELFTILGQKQFIANNNQWAFDSSDNTLYYRSDSSPSGLNLTATYSDVGIHLLGNIINIKNIDFTQYHRFALFGNYDTATNVTVDSCAFFDIKGYGILRLDNCDYWDVLNCKFKRIGVNGYRSHSAHNGTVHKNNFYFIGLDLNYPLDYAIIAKNSFQLYPTVGCGFQGGRSNSHTVTYNVADQVAYCGLIVVSIGSQVGRNICRNFLGRFADGGGIYTIGAEVGNPNYNNNFYQNFVYSPLNPDFLAFTPSQSIKPMGIYIDNFSVDITLDSNVIWDFYEAGIFMNTGCEEMVLDGNIILSGKRVGVGKALRVAQSTGIICNNNTFSQFNQDDSCFAYTSGVSFLSADNNHFIAPFQNKLGTVTGPGVIDDLAEYRTLFGTDANSNELRNYLTWNGNPSDQVFLIPNPTDDTIVGTLPAGYIDAEGNAITDYTIEPWSALFYTVEP